MSLFKAVDIGPVTIDPCVNRIGGGAELVKVIGSGTLSRTEVEELVAVLKEALER